LAKTEVGLPLFRGGDVGDGGDWMGDGSETTGVGGSFTTGTGVGVGVGVGVT